MLSYPSARNTMMEDDLEGRPTTQNPVLLLNNTTRLIETGVKVAFVYMKEEEFYCWMF